MKHFGYNRTREDAELLANHENDPPSFSIHLYPEHWILNSGPKFAYSNPVSSLLDYIRSLSIPSDFIEVFDNAGVSYYDGCLIVELLDYRPQKARDSILLRPDTQRVVLRPSPETIWADICLMKKKNESQWTDMDALKLEASVLLATSPPLCLDPDPHLARMVNSVLRVSTPSTPQSLKRKAVVVEVEEDEIDKAKRLKLMQFLNPLAGRASFHPNFRMLDFLENRKNATILAQSRDSTPSAPSAPTGYLMPPPIAPTMIMPQPGNMVFEDKSNIRPRIPTPSQSSAQQPVLMDPSSSQIQRQATLPPHQQNPFMPGIVISPNKQAQQLPSRAPSVAPSPSQSSQRTATPNIPNIPQSTLLVPAQAQNIVQQQTQPQSQIQSHVSNQPSLQQQTQQPQNQPQMQGAVALPYQFTPPIPPPQFLSAPPQGKRKQNVQQQPQKVGISMQPPPPQIPQNITTNPHVAAYARNQLLNAQQNVAQLQTGQSQNGRATPINPQNPNNIIHSPIVSIQRLGRASPMLPNQAAQVSPMLSSQSLGNRTPQNANQQSQRPLQQSGQQSQLLHHQPIHNLNVSAQNQYNTVQFRHLQQLGQQMIPQMPLRPQGASTPAPQSHAIQQQQQQSQNNMTHQQLRPEQAAAMQAQVQMLANMQYAPPPLYNYTMPPALHQQFAGWRVGAGRGAQQVNTQQQNMAPGIAHAQQMQAGRAAPNGQGGAPGR